MANIELKDLVLVFLGNESIDLEIKHFKADCPLAILGKGGAGKTNLLRVICGVERIKSGEIFINGVEVSTKKPKQRNIALISRDTPLFDKKTVSFNLQYSLKRRKIALNQDKIGHLLPILDKKVCDLSENQKIDVLFARAMLRNPDLILIDEPYALTQNLDYFLCSLKQHLDLDKLIIATFDKEWASQICNSTMILQRGRLKA